MVPSEVRYEDREWVDERASCGVCGLPLLIRVRTFEIARAARYVSARCRQDSHHDLTPETYTFLAELVA